MLARTVEMRRQNIRPDGYAHEEVDNQIRHDRCRTDRGQGHRRRKTPHDDVVGGRERQLQQRRTEQRPREDDDFAQQRPMAHVHGVFGGMAIHIIKCKP